MDNIVKPYPGFLRGYGISEPDRSRIAANLRALDPTDDLDLPGEPLPEGPEEPTTDPIIEEEPE